MKSEIHSHRTGFLLFAGLGLAAVLGTHAQASAAQAGSAKSSITFELMHTKPECSQPNMSSTWCVLDDMKAATDHSGMVKRIGELLDQYALKKAEQGLSPKVFINYFSFSNKAVHKKLCEVGKAGVQMEIVLDNGSRGQADTVEACQKDPQKPNIKVSYLGGMTSSPWRLYHNKFMMIDPGDDSPVSINFSSGNLSSFGTSLHLDHWVLMTAPKESNLVKAHVCVVQGIQKAIEVATDKGMYADGSVDSAYDEEVAQSYVSMRDGCYKKSGVIPMTESERAIQLEGVSPSFSPNNNDEAYKVLSAEIRKITARAKKGESTYIYIAIQHFLHRGVSRDLVNAKNAGVDVRIVMDDDVVLGSSEVQGVSEFYKQLKEQGLVIRFAQTNAEIRQMMHNKLAVFNGERSFSGAGHYTYAALQNNWENFYLIENAGLMKQYGEYFKELWEKSVDENGVKGGASSAPAPVSQKLLDLVEGGKKSAAQQIEN